MKRIIISLMLCLSSMASQANDELVRYFFSAARIGEVEVLEKYLEAGFPVDIVNQQSYTALMVAAYSGQMASVDVLLKHGANACIKDKRGNTAIMGALIKAELDIVKKLYKEDCNKHSTNKSGLTLEQFAEMYGKGDFLRQLE